MTAAVFRFSYPFQLHICERPAAMESTIRRPASKMTLDEIANYIAEDENWSDDVVILPPIEDSATKSDEDSDISDNEPPLLSIDHLPARILRSEVEVFHEIYDDDQCVVSTPPTKAKRPKKDFP